MFASNYKTKNEKFLSLRRIWLSSALFMANKQLGGEVLKRSGYLYIVVEKAFGEIFMLGVATVFLYIVGILKNNISF